MMGRLVHQFTRRERRSAQENASREISPGHRDAYSAMAPDAALRLLKTLAADYPEYGSKPFGPLAFTLPRRLIP